MDTYSHRLANALVGNDDGAATIEVTLTGPELEFTDDRHVAVTGAEFEHVSTEVFGVRAGQQLTFGRRLRGARAYIAISGGIDTPLVLGSRSTHVPSGMGGPALKAGDELPLGPPEGGHYVRSARTSVRPTSVRSVRLQADQTVLRVLPGPQADRFAADALDALQSAPYRIDPDSNRMGYRLTGPRLGHVRGADIISDATPPGVLQVPASGQPILLMADRQTTGGYAKIATVISADLSLAGQLAPGDHLRFAVCSPAEALAALIAEEQRLMAIAGRS
jgi:antagonist of KipI